MRSVIERLLASALKVHRVSPGGINQTTGEANWVCQGENC